ncbi:MAG TPA: hypothetical protein VNA22_01860 [Pyrinomonadaceae bacterium]|nr:hypothetical protein [Pyrinomonadaceae bacterium]
MEPSQVKLTLGTLPLGARLLVRSKTDWRVAVVCRIAEDKITISVASPGGHCYRLRRDPQADLELDGGIPFLTLEAAEPWRDNFTTYDVRW